MEGQYACAHLPQQEDRASDVEGLLRILADLLPHLERIQEELAQAKEEDYEPVNRAKISLLAYK